MARRKRSRARKTSRRRRVGAMSLNASNPAVMFGSLAAGFLLVGKPLNDAVDKLMKIDPITGDPTKSKIIGAAEAGIGAMLLMKKGRKTMPEVVAGGILFGAGLKRLLKEFGVMGGFRSVPVVSGFRKVPVIGNYSVPAAGLGAYSVPNHSKIMGSTDSGLRNGNSSLIG